MKNITASDFASLHTEKYSKKRKSQIKLSTDKKNILLIGPQCELNDKVFTIKQLCNIYLAL